MSFLSFRLSSLGHARCMMRHARCMMHDDTCSYPSCRSESSNYKSGRLDKKRKNRNNVLTNERSEPLSKVPSVGLAEKAINMVIILVVAKVFPKNQFRMHVIILKNIRIVKQSGAELSQALFRYS